MYHCKDISKFGFFLLLLRRNGSPGHG